MAKELDPSDAIEENGDGLGPEDMPGASTAGKQIADNGGKQEAKNNFLHNQLDKAKMGKDKFNGSVANKGKQAVGKAGKTAAKATGKATKLAAKAMAKVAMQVARIVAQAIASAVVSIIGAIGWPVIAIVGAIAVIGLLVVYIMSNGFLNGVGGGGAMAGQTTLSQGYQATELLALSKDPSASRQTVMDVVNREKQRLQVVRGLIEKKFGAGSSQLTDADAKLKKINADLESIITTQGSATTVKSTSGGTNKATDTSGWSKLVVATVDEIKAFDNILPLGERIAGIAESYKGTTTLTNGGTNAFGGGDPRNSCAAFVSTILKQAGGITFHTQSATEIWNNLHKMNGIEVIPYKGTYDVSKLQRGDVVWFGFGANSGMFNHVGIYLGNSMIADTSSNDHEVKVRNISVHLSGSFNPFAGAMRLQ